MKHFAVTITRTCGAGGTSIAKILSAHYGIEYYDRMLLRLAAGNSGINEAVFAAADEDTKKSPLFNAFKKVYNGEHILPEEAKPKVIECFEHILPEKSEYATNDDLFAYQAKVMKELIKENSFIVIGRGGDYVLKDYPYLVRVFVHSQYKDCLAHEMEIMQCSEKDAAERIAKTNKYRSDYYKHFTGREWMDARNYDLVLDTSRYTYQQCAEMIEAIVAERMKD